MAVADAVAAANDVLVAKLVVGFAAKFVRLGLLTYSGTCVVRRPMDDDDDFGTFVDDSCGAVDDDDGGTLCGAEDDVD